MTPPRGPALLLLALVTAAAAFNLEVRVPVVKVGGEYGDSFFGYSVAGHRAVAGPGGEAVVLVGAPQDRNLQPGTATSGALYRSVSCEYFYTADKYFFEILIKLSDTAPLQLPAVLGHVGLRAGGDGRQAAQLRGGLAAELPRHLRRRHPRRRAAGAHQLRDQRRAVARRGGQLAR